MNQPTFTRTMKKMVAKRKRITKMLVNGEKVFGDDDASKVIGRQLRGQQRLEAFLVFIYSEGRKRKGVVTSSTMICSNKEK